MSEAVCSQSSDMCIRLSERKQTMKCDPFGGDRHYNKPSIAEKDSHIIAMSRHHHY